MRRTVSTRRRRSSHRFRAESAIRKTLESKYKTIGVQACLVFALAYGIGVTTTEESYAAHGFPRDASCLRASVLKR